MTPSPATRILTVVRHGKAMPRGATDHARPLASRGIRDARDAGEWLARRSTGPVVGLVSTATRARQTWEALAAALDVTEARPLDGLYQAGVDDALEILRLLDETDVRVVLVGHNPTMQQLVWSLSDAAHGPAHATMADRGFPTTAVAVLEHGGPWRDLAPGVATLTDFHAPRD